MQLRTSIFGGPFSAFFPGCSILIVVTEKIFKRHRFSNCILLITGYISTSFSRRGFLLVFCGVTRIFRSSHISICYGSQTRSNGTVEIRNCLELTDLFVCMIKVGPTIDILFLFCISENSRFRKEK